jgi:hypothetical protein
MAHAVVMQVKFAEGADPEERMNMLNEHVVPHAKSQPGFLRGSWMHNGADGTGVVVFDSQENAHAAQEVLKPQPGGPQLVSCNVFEVAAEA